MILQEIGTTYEKRKLKLEQTWKLENLDLQQKVFFIKQFAENLDIIVLD